MFTHSTTKISNEHVNHIVSSILNKRQRNVLEQHKTFIRRNTDENQKRNNYLVDKFTMKKRTSSSKENVEMPSKKLISPKKKVLPAEINDEDDDDFISIHKRPKILDPPKIKPLETATDPIKECLTAIISQIENDDISCPICNQLLSNMISISQREEHVNRCIEKSQINHIDKKQQKSLLSYSKFSSATRKPSATNSASNFKCQICGLAFHVKRTFLSHLKKCSTENSVQLKHVIKFAAKTTAVTETKPTPIAKKKAVVNIKNRVVKMEVPVTEDDEQQQLAIALSASIKTASEPPNAFDILQAASKKTKTIDLLTTPLWSVSIEDKLKLSSKRISNICERLITITSSTTSYQFPPSRLGIVSQTNFDCVNWWNITSTDPQEDEIPLTQLARMLDENDE